MTEEELNALKVRLKTGEYDGKDIMKARFVIDELIVTNKLLKERERLLHVIPECPEHGRDCVPHAIDWVKEHKLYATGD